jgi:hypothetical protein
VNSGVTQVVITTAVPWVRIATLAFTSIWPPTPAALLPPIR